MACDWLEVVRGVSPLLHQEVAHSSWWKASEPEDVHLNEDVLNILVHTILKVKG